MSIGDLPSSEQAMIASGQALEDRGKAKRVGVGTRRPVVMDAS